MPSQGGKYLLFFDGGSRGNPGPGGSGAVIVALAGPHADPMVIRAAAMSYANPQTTNNTAEYGGLLAGLRVAAQRRLRPLEVIGDSRLILDQESTSGDVAMTDALERPPSMMTMDKVSLLQESVDRFALSMFNALRLLPATLGDDKTRAESVNAVKALAKDVIAAAKETDALIDELPGLDKTEEEQLEEMRRLQIQSEEEAQTLRHISMADLGYGGRVLAGEDSEEDEEEDEPAFLSVGFGSMAPMARMASQPKFSVATAPMVVAGATGGAEDSEEDDDDEGVVPGVDEILRETVVDDASTTPDSPSSLQTPTALPSTPSRLPDERLLSRLVTQNKAVCQNAEVENIAIVMNKLPQYIRKVQDIKATMSEVNTSVDRMRKRAESLRVDAQSHAIKKESKRASLSQWNKLSATKSYESAGNTGNGSEYPSIS
ncbi:hypothetical protein ATCC90586_002023 [Pythium insidiosum]|nr:hypothetical protein ATCC90586_002023 [Pythium insidiosum]